ncbi:MAG TPA: glycosyl hydrolase family 28-related protein [Acidobacteriota bacterium]|nr:glycosyl hydrolase family 28-related protein [Acidobacteriota bacterium]
MPRYALLAFSAILAVAPLRAASYYTVRLDDPQAVYLTTDNFSVKGDGVADDSDAIQQAIDRVQETTVQGIVFIPEGRYRIGKTIYVWPGVRLIGFGARRPVFVLGENTPGFGEGSGKYMIHFTGGRHRAGQPVRDGNPGTFYSAMSNVDIEIRDGNPAAIGVRFRIAQHCYLAHMDFRIGSGMAGIHDVGNEGEDLHFYGGEYGIMTRRPSPGWQYTLLDATFEGQRQAAIKTQEAGLTLVRNRFKHVPAAVSIDPGYAEELWMKDCRFEDISGPALIISNENNARTEINLENLVCRRVAVLAAFRESGRKVEGLGSDYVVRQFSHGLHIADLGETPAIKTTLDAAVVSRVPEPVISDIPDLPARDGWVNLRSLGAKGDGMIDDTEILKRAIAEHRTIYLPSGKYRVTDTIALRPDTVLIGLNPITTLIALQDSTPAFQGPGSPKALLETPKGGENIVTGIGIYTNGINSRAVGVKWMAGRNSMMNDVRLLGGHGTYKLDGTREQVYNNTHTADPDLNRRWDSQYASLWITDGGGGTFKDIWTPSTFAQAGMYVSDTSTEGRVYEMSIEHHVRNEVKIRNVANWHFYALQFEEERGESAQALPLEIDRSSNLLFANTLFYRVVSSHTPFPYAVKITASRDIRFRNFHCYSNSKVLFDTAVFDQTHKSEIRSYEMAVLTVSGNEARPRPRAKSVVLSAGAEVERLAGGFFNISGGAVDPGGNLYFVDAFYQRIYRWTPESRQLRLVCDSPLEPGNLAFDKAGNLLVVSYAGSGTVYSLKPESCVEITLLNPQPATPRPGMIPILPLNQWRLGNDFPETPPLKKPFHYISPDGTTFLPAGEDFVKGTLFYGAKIHDVLRAFGLGPALPGRPFYVCDESEEKTYAVTVDAVGTMTKPRLFAEQGGESVVSDAQGNVYIAAGQVCVYDPSGTLIDTIEVPQRPIDLVFGGKDRRTLFILTRNSLYGVRVW